MLLSIKHEEEERIVIFFKVLSKEETSLYKEGAELFRDLIYSKFELVIKIMLDKRLHYALVIVCLRNSHTRHE
jgi:hypothetical protein